MNNTFPIIHTKRLDLIEIREKHLCDLYKLFGDENATRFYNLLPLQKEEDAQMLIDRFRSRFSEGLAIRWGIAIKGEQHIIGTVGFNSYENNHKATIGYDLQTLYWGKGYATEALRAVINFGFQSLGINRIEAEIMTGNLASEKVLSKLGFTKEGVLRQWMLWNGKHYDMAMYSLLKDEHIPF